MCLLIVDVPNHQRFTTQFLLENVFDPGKPNLYKWIEKYLRLIYYEGKSAKNSNKVWNEIICEKSKL